MIIPFQTDSCLDFKKKDSYMQMPRVFFIIIVVYVAWFHMLLMQDTLTDGIIFFYVTPNYAVIWLSSHTSPLLLL